MSVAFKRMDPKTPSGGHKLIFSMQDMQGIRGDVSGQPEHALIMSFLE